MARRFRGAANRVADLVVDVHGQLDRLEADGVLRPGEARPARDALDQLLAHAGRRLACDLMAEAVSILRVAGPEARPRARIPAPRGTGTRERQIHMSANPWFDIVSKYLRENVDIYSVTVHELLDRLLDRRLGKSAAELGRDAQAEQRVGRALKKLGWVKKRDGKPDADGMRARRWWRPEAGKGAKR
jgi:hypothetical protein